jgi:predicted nucleic acid-binding Zn ribbon protein
MSRFTPPGDCPVCGAPVPAGARSCKECGSCEQTGWGDDTQADALDLPEPEETAERSQRQGSEADNKGTRIDLNTGVMLVLIVALVLAWVVFVR